MLQQLFELLPARSGIPLRRGLTLGFPQRVHPGKQGLPLQVALCPVFDRLGFRPAALPGQVAA